MHIEVMSHCIPRIFSLYFLQEIVLYATPDGSRTAAASRVPASNLTSNSSHPDDIRFCNEIQTALKISECALILVSRFKLGFCF